MKKAMTIEQQQEMFRVTDEKVEQAVKGLVEAYDPIYIYTFGSYAKGQIDEDSDFDVMAVVDEYDDKPWKMMVRGYEGMKGVNMPIDFLLYDKAKFEACKNDATSFCHKIIRTGRLLYERKKT